MSTKAKMAIIGLLAVGVAACSVSPSGPPIAAPTTVATLASPTQVAPSAPPATTAGPVTLLDLKGSGTKNSQPFTTTGQWTLTYTFDCTAFLGGKGNFQVFVYEGTAPVGVAANEYAAKGDNSSPQYATGELHLQMNSTCDKWHVTVTQP